jgi:hypothetical protein
MRYMACYNGLEDSIKEIKPRVVKGAASSFVWSIVMAKMMAENYDSKPERLFEAERGTRQSALR